MSLFKRMRLLEQTVASSSCTDSRGNVLNVEDAIVKIQDLLFKLRSAGNKLYILGNGGSAAIASHAVTDFFKFCKISAHVLHDSALLTCLSNDYGYNVAFAQAVATSMHKNDILIAISSSGASDNICNAATKAREIGATLITMSGFKVDNRLRSLGAYNFWLDSMDYGIVEIGHQCILHNISDGMGESLELC